LPEEGVGKLIKAVLKHVKLSNLLKEANVYLGTGKKYK
jgi:hypothetical protein